MVGTAAAAGLGDLLRAAARERPGQVAIVDGATRITYAELDARVSAAARSLGELGLTDGARVALQLLTGADFVLLYLAVLRAGLVAVPVNPAYTLDELAHLVTDSGTELHLDVPSGRRLLDGLPGREGAAGADRDPGRDPNRDRRGEDLAVLLYTSGTSSRARGAMLSARALVANLDQLAAVDPPLVTGDDVVFVPLPLTHVFGLNAGLGMALRVGATAVLADRFEPAATLALMAAERVTVVLGVPGQYAAWLAQPQLATGFASVRFAMSGSATLTRAVVDGYAAAGIALHDGYGLTEAAPVVAINALGPDRAHPVAGSVGLPLPGIEVELRDAGGEPVDDGDPGRIFVRGANLFSGYWPDGADGPDEEGWFGTGDIACADEAGRLRLVGRSSDLVIVNGFNVYPAEVEAVLAAQPGVAQVAVVGVADEHTGEAVHAYVVPSPGSALDPAELLHAAAGSLARFKLPSRLTVVDTLPRTVTGKIMKWQLDRGAAGAAR